MKVFVFSIEGHHFSRIFTVVAKTEHDARKKMESLSPRDRYEYEGECDAKAGEHVKVKIEK